LNAYLDASVLLRVVMGQPRALDLGLVSVGIASSLVEVECHRTLDCARLRGELDHSKFVESRTAVVELLDKALLLDVTPSTLRRAAQPMPTQLRTLDAIHLTTALLWTEATGESLTMATHDVALAMAARAHGMTVIGA